MSHQADSIDGVSSRKKYFTGASKSVRLDDDVSDEIDDEETPDTQEEEDSEEVIPYESNVKSEAGVGVCSFSGVNKKLCQVGDNGQYALRYITCNNNPETTILTNENGYTFGPKGSLNITHRYNRIDVDRENGSIAVNKAKLEALMACGDDGQDYCYPCPVGRLHKGIPQVTVNFDVDIMAPTGKYTITQQRKYSESFDIGWLSRQQCGMDNPSAIIPYCISVQTLCYDADQPIDVQLINHNLLGESKAANNWQIWNSESSHMGDKETFTVITRAQLPQLEPQIVYRIAESAACTPAFSRWMALDPALFYHEIHNAPIYKIKLQRDNGRGELEIEVLEMTFTRRLHEQQMCVWAWMDSYRAMARRLLASRGVSEKSLAFLNYKIKENHSDPDSFSIAIPRVLLCYYLGKSMNEIDLNKIVMPLGPEHPLVVRIKPYGKATTVHVNRIVLRFTMHYDVLNSDRHTQLNIGEAQVKAHAFFKDAFVKFQEALNSVEDKHAIEEALCVISGTRKRL